MKQLLAMALIGAVTPAMAVKFWDPIGDVNQPMAGNNVNYDLVSFEIFTDLEPVSNIPRMTVTYTVNSPDIQNPNWAKMVMAIRGPDQGFGVNTGPSTGWPRAFNIAGGSNRWVGGWVDGAFGGFECRTWNGTDFGASPAGATWLNTPGMISTISGSQAIYQFYLSTLGLQLGDTIYFEPTSTAGGDGDGAIDPVSTFQNQITDWGQQRTLDGFMYRISTDNTVQTLSGSITLNDTVASLAVPRSISVMAMEGTSVVASSVVVATGPVANFSIEVPATSLGAAKLVFDGSSFLKRAIDVTLTGAVQAIGGSVVMLNGDVDTSGEVDAVDIDDVIANFGFLGDAITDVDVSGEVDAVDIDIVIANFGGLDD